MMAKLAIASCLLMCSCAAAQTRPDLQTVKERWLEWTVPAGTNAITLANAARVAMNQQGKDGCWADVPYGDSARSLWKADLHLNRLNVIAAAAFALRRDGHANVQIEAAGERAVACWLRRDPKNPNWWWNEIGVPQELGRAALLLQTALTRDDLAGVGQVLRLSVWTKWTGQNLVWGTSIEVLRGLMENDAAVVQEAYVRLFEEVRIAPVITPEGKPGEGIQADGSFHQHGAQLYSGGYGYGFGTDVGRAVVLTWGTRFQITAEPMRIYTHFVLDGQQWMMRSGTFDYLARGREITREEGRSKAEADDFEHVVSALAALDLPRRSEFGSFAKALHGGSEVAGNRNFWNSDYMVHRRAGYAVSVRMFSIRMQNEEIVNGEGERSVHLADGASLLYLRGDEYRGIFPAWDWSMIPGTTALHWLQNGIPQTGEPKSVGQMGETDFVGGASDGEYGVATIDLKRGVLRAKKSWFFFDDEYLALGSGIRMQGSARNESVVTTIDQTRSSGKTSQKKLNTGATVAANGDVGYLLQPEAKAFIKNAAATGRWSDIGTGRDDRITVPVFTLAMDHGANPRDASYAYTVLPTGGIAAAEREAISPRVKVLANDENIQAVESKKDKMVQAVFYSVGSLKTSLGVLQVTQPCAVILRRINGSVRLAVANPRATAAELNVSLDARTLSVVLEGGESGGRSAVQWLPK